MSPQKSARRTGAQPATRTGRARKDKTRVLVPYKVPKRVEFRDSLPKSAVGKVLRRELVAGCK